MYNKVMKNRLNKLIGGIHPKAEAHGHSAAVPVGQAQPV